MKRFSLVRHRVQAPKEGGDDKATGVRGTRLDRDLKDFMDDVRRLVRYAVETDNLPKGLDVGRLYAIQRKYRSSRGADPPTPTEYAALVDAYQTLERRLGRVSADTLKATEDVINDLKVSRPRRVFGKSTSSASRFVEWLRWRTYANLLVILIAHLLTDAPGIAVSSTSWLSYIASWGIPFLYGALGADAYILRRTTRKLSERQFDPRQIPEYRTRFLLGTVAGGAIVLLVRNTGALAAEGLGQWSFAALGFLAGFSNDFLFTTIERILAAVLPKVQSPAPELATPGAQLTEGQRDEMIQRVVDEYRAATGVGRNGGEPVEPDRTTPLVPAPAGEAGDAQPPEPPGRED